MTQLSLLPPPPQVKPVVAENGMMFNAPNVGNGLTLLRQLKTGIVPCVFFDPQFRGVLDHLGYGNEGARQSERAELPQMSDDLIRRMLREIERVLRPSRYLFLFLDKHAVCEGMYRMASLPVVDMITWGTGKFGMGYRTRRVCQYLVVMQKPPLLAKETWTDHGIPDVWEERAAGDHPHAKPVELQKRLIASVTLPGEFIIDPAAGSYSVMRAAHAVGRRFFGCDLRAWPPLETSAPAESGVSRRA